jgi:hypothetical protein
VPPAVFLAAAAAARNRLLLIANVASRSACAVPTLPGAAAEGAHNKHVAATTARSREVEVITRRPAPSAMLRALPQLLCFFSLVLYLGTSQ